MCAGRDFVGAVDMMPCKLSYHVRCHGGLKDTSHEESSTDDSDGLCNPTRRMIKPRTHSYVFCAALYSFKSWKILELLTKQKEAVSTGEREAFEVREEEVFEVRRRPRSIHRPLAIMNNN